MSVLEEKIKTSISPIITNLGYKVYDIVYEKEGKDNYLRIFIDSNNDNGISIDDCEKVNDAINDILDEKDFIKSYYFLEVSSPGLERNIRTDEHLQSNIGSKIEVHLYKAVNKEKIIQGVLKSFDKETITIQCNENQKIDRKNIASMKTVYDWTQIS